MFQWATTLTQSGANLPFAKVLRVDKVEQGFQVRAFAVSALRCAACCTQAECLSSRLPVPLACMMLRLVVVMNSAISMMCVMHWCRGTAAPCMLLIRC